MLTPVFRVCAAAVILSVVVVAAADPVSPVRPPKLQYTYTELPNGLRLVVKEDHSVPIVNVQVWYHVGSKNERDGLRGFAHLFEHLMFQGSQNVEAEQYPSMVAAVGGQSNAYTTEDTTVYWATVPSHYLPLVLWLEADRMATMRIDQRAFEREVEVVKEERRMRVDNQPFGRLSEIIYDQAFTAHPYKHPVIGYMDDLDAASLDDVREFYRTFYVPSNATIAIVGAVDTDQALSLVTQYFDRIPRAQHEVPRDIPAEPPQTRERRVTIEEDFPLPVVVVAHHIPYDGHPHSYPLHVVSKILSDGQSARIHRRLVYEDQVALAAFGGGNIIEHPNLFYAVAMVQPGRDPADAIDALIEELERLQDEPVTDRELTRAKNQFARDYILGRETAQQKASHLAHAIVLHHGDVASVDEEFDIFMDITKDDLETVAREYFRPENRLVLTILPRGQAPGGGTVPGDAEAEP